MTSSLLKLAVQRLGADAVTNAFDAKQWDVLRYEWPAWALPEQLEPGTPSASSPRDDWDVWLMLAGRGSGKTRAGSEWVRKFAYDNPGCRIALIARTAGDVRTTMIEGPSGIMAVSPPWFMPVHNPSSAKITWPNGSIALHFSAEEPKGLRGPQFSAAWCDELAAWPTLKNEDGEPGIPNAWTQLQYGVRMPGKRTPIIVTTTPRPLPIVRDLVKHPRTVVTKWTTFDNADNLAEGFVDRMKAQSTTRMARQELYAEILDDVPGALWSRATLESCRRDARPDSFRRVVVAVDPSGGHDAQNDEQGIVVAALGQDGHAYVLEDCTCKLTPDGWGRVAVAAYARHGADRLCFERNFGGEMVEHVIKTAARTMGLMVATKEVSASRGKVVRAEPIAALYEQGLVYHVGSFPALEDQLCLFTPDGDFQKSPDRADALIWALTELMLKDRVTLGAAPVVSPNATRTTSTRPLAEDDDDDDARSNLIQHRGGRFER